MHRVGVRIGGGYRMNRRLVKEIDMLMKDPGPGIAASLVEGSMNTLEAQIIGPEGSPYEDGVFMLSLTITDRYCI